MTGVCFLSRVRLLWFWLREAKRKVIPAVVFPTSIICVFAGMTAHLYEYEYGNFVAECTIYY